PPFIRPPRCAAPPVSFRRGVYSAARARVADRYVRREELTMRPTAAACFVVALSLSAAATYLRAQQPPRQPAEPMGFFITSAGPGNGANLGGLAGADRPCQP